VSNERITRWLGSEGRDPGCEGCFEVLDEYADALLRGVDAAGSFPEVIVHLESCAACREDTEGLLAALRGEQTPEEPGSEPGRGSR